MLLLNISWTLLLLLDDKVNQVEDIIIESNYEPYFPLEESDRIFEIEREKENQEDIRDQLEFKLQYTNIFSRMREYKFDFEFSKFLIVNWTEALKYERILQAAERQKFIVNEFKKHVEKAVANFNIKQAKFKLANIDWQEAMAKELDQNDDFEDIDFVNFNDAEKELIHAQEQVFEAKDNINYLEEKLLDEDHILSQITSAGLQFKISAAIKAIATDFYYQIKSNVANDVLNECYLNIIDMADVSTLESILLNHRLQEQLNIFIH